MDTWLAGRGDDTSSAPQLGEAVADPASNGGSVRRHSSGQAQPQPIQSPRWGRQRPGQDEFDEQADKLAPLDTPQHRRMLDGMDEQARRMMAEEYADAQHRRLAAHRQIHGSHTSGSSFVSSYGTEHPSGASVGFTPSSLLSGGMRVFDEALVLDFDAPANTPLQGHTPGMRVGTARSYLPSSGSVNSHAHTLRVGNHSYASTPASLRGAGRGATPVPAGAGGEPDSPSTASSGRTAAATLGAKATPPKSRRGSGLRINVTADGFDGGADGDVPVLHSPFSRHLGGFQVEPSPLRASTDVETRSRRFHLFPSDISVTDRASGSAQQQGSSGEAPVGSEGTSVGRGNPSRGAHAPPPVTPVATRSRGRGLVAEASAAAGAGEGGVTQEAPAASGTTADPGAVLVELQQAEQAKTMAQTKRQQERATAASERRKARRGSAASAADTVAVPSPHAGKAVTTLQQAVEGRSSNSTGGDEERTPPGGRPAPATDLGAQPTSAHATASYDVMLPSRAFAPSPVHAPWRGAPAVSHSTSSLSFRGRSSSSSGLSPDLPAATADGRCNIVSVINEGERSLVLLGTPAHTVTEVTCDRPAVAVKMSLPDFDSRVRLAAQARLLAQHLPPHPRIIELLGREGLRMSSVTGTGTMFLPMALHDGDLLDWLMDPLKRATAPVEPPLGDSSLAHLHSRPVPELPSSSAHSHGRSPHSNGLPPLAPVGEDGGVAETMAGAGHGAGSSGADVASVTRGLSSGTERQSGASTESLDHKPAPLHAVHRLAWQLVQAVRHCHRHGVYHLNVNLENILVDDAGCHLVLTGFGSATRILELEGASSCTHPCGSNPCTAPEALACMRLLQSYKATAPSSYEDPRLNNPRLQYDAAKADAWAVGAVVYALLVGRHPWGSASMEDSDFAYYANTGKFREYREDYRDLEPGSDEMRVVLALLDLNVGRRAGMEQAAAMLRRMEWAPPSERGRHYGDTPPEGSFTHHFSLPKQGSGRASSVTAPVGAARRMFGGGGSDDGGVGSARSISAGAGAGHASGVMTRIATGKKQKKSKKHKHSRHKPEGRSLSDRLRKKTDPSNGKRGKGKGGDKGCMIM